jgi:hypothetical protein
MMMPMPSAAVMSDETRYEQNLKVVRRRDPSILRIFDQFPHVTVYEYLYEQEPPRWEKYGCEGTMFLFERQVDHIMMHLLNTTVAVLHVLDKC